MRDFMLKLSRAKSVRLLEQAGRIAEIEEALRKSTLALCSAGQVAADFGDEKAAKFYDAQAAANTKLLGLHKPTPVK